MKCGRRLGIWHFLNWLLKNTNCFWLSLLYNLCTMGSPLIHGLDSEVILPEEKSQCCQSYSWESCKLSFNFQNPGPQILKRTCILFMHINTSSLPWNNGVQGFVWTKNYSISYFKKKPLCLSFLFSSICPFTPTSTSTLISSLSAISLQTSKLMCVMLFHHTVMDAADVNQRLQQHYIFIWKKLQFIGKEMIYLVRPYHIFSQPPNSCKIWM